MSSSMFMIGVTLQLYDRMTSNLRNVTTGLDKLREKTEKLRSASVGLMADGFLAGGAIAAPIKAFADLDEASTNLRVAMMDNMGRIPPLFEAINKQAIELGNLLPGTTADFTNAATALIENGTALNVVVNGGLKAASYLGVILKMAPSDAAEMVAKFREAYGLTENELVKMADLTQKAKFAFGLNPEEIKYAAQYMGASLNALHLTGADNAKTILAFQGFARQKGMEGSVFGTNFAQMLNQMGQLESKMGRTSKPMQQVNQELAKHRIHLEFFNKQGKFLGLENMMAQLQKLRVLSDQERLNVTNRLFGMEGGRVASMGIDMGVDGLKKQVALMEKQADIMQRIDAITRSAKNTWEAFTGTVTNLMAAFGSPLVEALKPYIVELNVLTGGPLQDFVDRHKTLVKWVGGAILAFAVLAIGLGAVGLAFAGVLRYVALVAPIFRGVAISARLLGPIFSGLAWLTRLFAVAIGKDLVNALRFVWAFAAANPILAIGIGIAAAAIWVITHWKQVKKFFADLWDWFKRGIQQLNNWLPDWFKKYTVPGAAINLAAKTLGPDKPSAAGAGKAHITGQVEVVVHQDGRPPTVSVKRAHGGVDINAYAGQTMVGP